MSTNILTKIIYEYQRTANRNNGNEEYLFEYRALLLDYGYKRNLYKRPFIVLVQRFCADLGSID
jgi:hypothetical protein